MLNMDILCIFLQEAPPDYGGVRAKGQAVALPRIVSAPCLLSVSVEASSQNRLVASSLKRKRDALEPFGSAEGHKEKATCGGCPSSQHER